MGVEGVVYVYDRDEVEMRYRDFYPKYNLEED